MKLTVEMPHIMDQKELAKYLGVTEAWCERARWAQEGPKFFKLGGKRLVRYRAEDVVSWIDKQKGSN